MIEPISTQSLIKIATPLVSKVMGVAGKLVKEKKMSYDASTVIEKLADSIIYIDRVKTIWSPDEEVSIQEFYYPASIFYKGKIKFASSFSDLPNCNLIIEGIVGQGKSIFLRHLAVSVIYEGDRVPVFLELRNIEKQRNLLSLVLDKITALGFDNAAALFPHLAREGKFVLFLDGFDEVSPDLVSSLVYDLSNMSQQYPKLRMILSSRPDSGAISLSRFEFATLRELGENDYNGFLDKLNLSPEKKFLLIDAVALSSSSVKGVITTPLMLTLLVLVYISEKEIPENIPDFYESLFGVVFSGHDKIKTGFDRTLFSGLSERRLQNLFESFCFACVQSGITRSLTGEQFYKVFTAALEISDSNCACEVEGFKGDIVKVTCLMLEDGFNKVSFLHKSIMDYFSAAFISHSIDEIATDFYKSISLEYQPFRYTLEFLSVIDSYRYSRDYILGDFLQHYNSLSLALEHGESALIDFFEREMPLLEFSIEENESISYIVRHAEAKNEFFMSIPGLFVKHLLQGDGDAVIKKKRRRGSRRVDGLKFRDFEGALPSNFIIGLRGVEIKMKAAIEAAEKVIESENTKLDRLGKLRGALARIKR